MQMTSPEPSAPVRNRVLYLDIIRALSCLCVVMIHVSCEYVIAELGSMDFWLGNFFDSLVRASVPLFVMVSGALFLDERYPFTRESWLRHIGKLLSFYLFWSALYAIIYEGLYPLVFYNSFSLSRILWGMINGHIHLWFIPMLIGLYLLLPLLRLWVKAQNRRYIEYFLFLSLIFSFIIPQGVKLLDCIYPELGKISILIDHIQMNYPVGYLSYFILGWYLHHCELHHRGVIYALGIAGFCMTFFGTYALRAWTHAGGYWFYENLTVNVLFSAIALFTLAKSVFGRMQYASTPFHRFIRVLSRYSLGVYAVHIMVIAIVKRFFSNTQAFVGILAIFIVSALVSVFASFIMSKLPVIRKFV